MNNPNRSRYSSIMKVSSLLLVLFGVSPFAMAITANFQTVKAGLDAPRGMDIDSKGNLYVAQAGFGDPSAYPLKAFALTRSYIVGPACPGKSSKIIMINKQNKVKTLVKNFWSEAVCFDFTSNFGIPIPQGSVAVGLYGLQVSENNKGDVKLLVTVNESTESMDSACRPGGVVYDPGPPQALSCAPGFSPSNPADLQQATEEIFGFQDAKIIQTLGRFDLSDNQGNAPPYKIISDEFRKIEQATNPDQINTAGPALFPFPTRMETDPVALLTLSNNYILVVDAGANVIWKVVDGVTSVAVVMPNIGCNAAPCTVGTNLQESVPTAIAQNPVNGRIYIGEYGGGAANVTRIFELKPSNNMTTWTVQPITVSGDLTAFSGILGMGFDKNGTLYAVEFDKDGIFVNGGFNDNSIGRLTKLTFTSATSATATIIDDTTLRGPSGLRVGNGKVYISNRGDSGPGLGEILSWTIP